ncbi:T9SS type A sorting domain-containing protein [Alkaliflexus imshenetskii]|uniref:T9SS type A sorting domain-containing protein n=1 Tax=Alkaliflexus imshenetskii TaxID=286730 RepID=UPI00047DAFF7|nr:T9SS type A sorting domain-containing protein [Alkaliflexus imshenetskii]
MTTLLNVAKTLFLAFAFFIASHSISKAQNVDPDFKPVIKANPNLTAISVLPDGDVIIAGNYSSIGNTPTNAVVKLKSDGSLDNTFQTSIYLNESARITALHVDSDGKVLLGSNNYKLNGSEHLIRLTSDGKFDETFSVGNTLQFINKIQQQDDGKYLVSSWSGIGLARLNSDGSIDQNFNPYQDEFGLYTGAFQLLNDGKIISAIHYSTTEGTIGKLVRLNADGTLDETFETGTCDILDLNSTFIYDIKIQPDGKILIAGRFKSFKEQDAEGIFRLNEDGTIDETFTTSGAINNILNRHRNNEIEISEDGKILVAGSPLGYPLSYKVLRLNADGTMDETFSVANFQLPDITEFKPLIKLYGERIYVAGDHISCNNIKGFGITALNPSGSIIEEFSPEVGGNPVLYAAYKQDDGKIIIGGEFSQVNGFYINNIVRFNADGSVDPTFLENIGTGTNGAVRAIAGQSDLSLIIGGDFTTVNGVETGLLARIKPEGLIDTEFLAKVQRDLIGEGVDKILIDPTDQIIISGAFIYVNSEPRKGFAVFESDGSLNTFIGATPLLSNQGFRVTDMAYQSDKKLLVGGVIHNEVDNYGFLIRLNTDGTVDSDFINSVSDIQVSSLAVIDNNKIVVGNFGNGYDKNYLTQLEANGELIDNTLISFYQAEGGFPQINSIQHPGGDQLIIGGRFTSVNDIEKPALIKVSLNGDVDEFFKYDVEGKVTRFLQTNETQMFVVGSFNRIGNESDLFCIAKIDIDFPQAPTELDGKLSSLKSTNSGIELNWKKNSTNETGFSIERSIDNKAFKSIETIGSSANSFFDRDLVANQKYYYRVKAYNTNGGSSYSNVFEAEYSPTFIKLIENSKEVFITPNPGNGKILVTLNDFPNRSCDIEVYSTAGNLVLKGNYIVQANNQSISLDISKEPAGLYFIKINAKDYNKAIKYIKYQ